MAVAGVLGISNNRYPFSIFPLSYSLSLLLAPSLSPTLSLSLSLSLSSANLLVISELLSPYSVDVSVKRCGGAYGAKITRANLTAAACALGAHATKR